MARRRFNDGQEVVYQDFNKISAATERSLYDRVIFELIHKTEDAFFGEGFKVSYLGPTSVTVAAGFGFQSDEEAASPEPTKKPLYLPESQTLNLEAPDSVNPRIDIVCAKYALVDEITETRKYKDAVSYEITSESFVVQSDEEAELLVVTGAAAESPVAPSVPAGYIKIAECSVSAISGLSGSEAVTDSRSIVPIGSLTALNTLGFDRLTASSSISVADLMTEIDALLYKGYFNCYDVEDLVANPASPSASRVRLFAKDGVLYFKNPSGYVNPVAWGANPVGPFTIANNTGPANVTGLIFDKTAIKSAKIMLSVRRKTDSEEREEVGELYAVYRESSNTWDVHTNMMGDDSGVTFSITSGGQIQYTSDNMAGSNYVGSLRTSGIQTIKI